MSVLKLELLPNEILTDLLEKYINGIDVLNAFAFQLNRRFDALIIQSQRLRFDFMQCHKNDFRFCIGLLPAYIDKIEELTLSEQNTPGQIYAFLSYFPSFNIFQRLRKLYLHINAEAVPLIILQNALLSIPETTVHTLGIKITKAQIGSSLDHIVVKIFGMKTLKTLSIFRESGRMNWIPLSEVSSNIEYLTVHGDACQFESLKYIFRCASALKYLNIELSPATYYDRYKWKSSLKDPITQMAKLHTAILNITGDDQKTPTLLEPYLKCMPSLQRLKIITGKNALCDMFIWETLLKTSLPTLTYFSLETNAFRLNEIEVENILKSIQTSFWIEKDNFNIIIKQYAEFNVNRSSRNNRQNFSQYDSNSSVDKWWIGPRRKLNSNLSTLNTISNLNISTKSSSLLQNHCLDNVNCLVVHDFNDNLLELLTTYVNCSRIKYLDVSLLEETDSRISSLIRYTRNIESIRIKFNQLSDNLITYLSGCKRLKFVNLSTNSHSFDERQISIVANMFPYIEHLIINSPDIRNVPMLQTYIPRLRSLTLTNAESSGTFSLDDYEEKMVYQDIRRATQFHFEYKTNGLTIWINQDALEDTFWQIESTNLQQSTNDLLFHDDEW